MKLSFTFRFIKCIHKNMNLRECVLQRKLSLIQNVADAGIFQKLEEWKTLENRKLKDTDFVTTATIILVIISRAREFY